MRLNTIKPGAGSKRTRLRVGRGASAGQGKTCGRGVKGQRARKGGYHKVGFEGGQMPLQRRLPKIGFRSAMKASRAELTLSDLMRVTGSDVTLAGLIVGLVASAALTRFMQAALFGVGPLDATSFVAAPVALILVAMAACLRPAIHAASVDPARALRAE